MVIDPKVLTGELENLRARGIDVSGLRISANAHLIMPYHLMLDSAGEARLGKLQIGTTRRGIGPCYADKAARLGIRVQDLLDEKILKKKILLAMEPKRQSLRPYAKAPELDLQSMTDAYLTYGHRIEQYITDTARLTWDVLDGGGDVLFEGAQATMLDIDHGTYPFVTSSNPVAGSASTGTGAGPKDIDEIWGITKAYATRVGAGPFPTELDGELGRHAARGRRRVRHHHRPRPPRRLDRPRRPPLRRAPEHADRARDHEARRPHRPRRAARLHRLPRRRGGALRQLPVPPDRAAPGHRRVRGARRAGTRTSPRRREEADLPQTARDYLAFLADFVGVPIALVGVGPGREQVIWTEAGRATAAGRRVAVRLAAPSRCHHPRVDDEVVQAAVLLVPQRPQDVEQRRDPAGERAGDAEEEPT